MSRNFEDILYNMPPKQAENKEGLLKRSKRLFGNKPLDASKSYGGQNSAAPDDPTSAYQRRRSQVRRAQRTHRERKENYLKYLEQEVVSLRQQNKKQARRYEAEIVSLKDIIIEHGLPLPQPFPYLASEDISDASNSPKALVTVNSDAQAGNHLQMDWSSSSDMLGPPDTNHLMALSDSSMEAISAPAGVSSSHATSGSRSQGSLPASLQPGITPTTSQSFPPLPNNLTDAQLGIDFVLALEHPCMGHPHLLREPDQGHGLMLSNDILRSPGAPETVDIQDLKAGSSSNSTRQSHSHSRNRRESATSGAGPGVSSPSWEVNPTDLDRLLDLSSTFQLAGELTPVQAWTRLRAHPGFTTLDRNRLLAFQRALTQDVKCYGSVDLDSPREDSPRNSDD